MWFIVFLGGGGSFRINKNAVILLQTSSKKNYYDLLK